MYRITHAVPARWMGILATTVVLGMSVCPSAFADGTSPAPTPGDTPSGSSSPTPTARTVPTPTSPKKLTASAKSAGMVSDLANGTPTELAELLVGSDATVSNVTYTGSVHAAGIFAGVDVGIDAGVALTTGSLESSGGRRSSILGPVQTTGTSTQWGLPGDTELTTIVGDSTHDASVLDFDFVPDRDQATFSYVFGSSEYAATFESFNDGVAYSINGKDYAEFTDDNGATQPVSVDTINGTTNSRLFVNNLTGAHDTALPGFTTVMTFTAPLTRGQVNHLRIAIADTEDDVYDSAVLLEPAAFPNTPPVAHDVSGVSVQPGKTVTIALKGTDADDDSLTYYLEDAPDPKAGKVTIDPDTGKATFTAAAGFTGTATFTYVVNDGLVDSDPATVTVRVSAPSPSVSPTPTASATPTTGTLADTGSSAGGLAPLGAALALSGVVVTAGVGLRRRRS